MSRPERLALRDEDGAVREYERVRFGREQDFGRLAQTAECHDCGVAPGELHRDGCDTEVCPRCAGQLLTCECEGSNHG